MKVGCGISDFSDSLGRARQASDLAMGNAGLVRAHTALVFTQADDVKDTLAMLSTVRQVTGAQQVIGASAVGVLSQDGEWEEGPSCAVMAFEFGAKEETVKSSLLRQGYELDPKSSDGSAMMVLGDPGLFNLDVYNSIYHDRNPNVFGGGASSFSEKSPGAPVFYQGHCYREASCAITFPKALKPTMSVMYGCRAVCAPVQITKVKNNLVLELGGKPALAVLERTLSKVVSGSGPKDLKKEMDQPLPLLAGVITEEKPSVNSLPTPADFYIRPIMAVDPASGGIIVGENLREGSYITFVLREKEWAHQELDVSLRELKTNLAGGKPKFGFYFNCAGRGSNLYGEENHDVDLIRKHLGAFPLIGMSSSFELAPQGGQLAVHSFTGVLAVFS